MLAKEELILINAGAINGTIINAIVRGATFVYEVGQALGSAVRRIRLKKVCK